VGRVAGLNDIWLFLYCFILFLIYDSFFSFLNVEKQRNGSIGKYFGKLKIIKENDDSIGWVIYLLRSLIKLLCSPLIIVSYLSIVLRKDKKALHDIILNTSVINYG